MTSTTFLLIEDNLADEPKIQHLLMRHSLENRILIVDDEAEALDYLYSIPAVEVLRCKRTHRRGDCLPTSTVVE